MHQHCNPVWCGFNQRSDPRSALGSCSCWIRETECDQEPRRQSVSRHGSESRCQSCFSFLSLLGLFCTCQNIHSFVLHSVNHITAPLHQTIYRPQNTKVCLNSYIEMWLEMSLNPYLKLLRIKKEIISFYLFIYYS